ncbi:hypothetical protein [Nocardioides sp. YIM 152315]|uniref:hypothetical protein n=1 Tax=Nocardioides sp. YIM 152315 TaxID=3031760 RepID=UPI0023DAAD87|nr:hypothetical protein [Nocardioides sp. YIM 152315]MDF1603360.1 hypothetical protein [Nocardioides sp. YIM 152315]
MSSMDAYYERGNTARASIVGFLHANAAELRDLGFTPGGHDWPLMAVCDECAALVPYKAAELIDPCRYARKHREKCPRKATS